MYSGGSGMMTQRSMSALNLLTTTLRIHLLLLAGRTQMTQSTGNRPSSLKTAYARAYAHGDVQDILRTRTHARGTTYRMEQ